MSPKLTQKVLLAGRREGVELILISLEVIRAAIDSLVRVRVDVDVVDRLVIAMVSEPVVVADRLLVASARKIILLEVVVRLVAERLELVGVDGVVRDERNDFDVWQCLGLVVTLDDFGVGAEEHVATFRCSWHELYGRRSTASCLN